MGLNRLDSLDFSLNNLNGNLTPLGSLLALGKVNVSYDQFMSSIPDRWLQLLNLTSDFFLGNPDLCISCHTCVSLCKASRGSKGLRKVYFVAIVLGSAAFCFMLCLVLCTTQAQKSCSYGNAYLASRVYFCLKKVMEATENLNEKYELGRGAQGTVYKAYLSPDKVYAMKKIIFRVQKGSNRSMTREIKILGNIKHRNLVKLVNFWLRDDYELILYTYMEGGSLHDVLHEMKPAPVLEWKVMCKIAVETAQGLAYLHENCHPAILHRDIKPKNILLDLEIEPHMSDFGIEMMH